MVENEEIKRNSIENAVFLVQKWGLEAENWAFYKNFEFFKWKMGGKSRHFDRLNGRSLISKWLNTIKIKLLSGILSKMRVFWCKNGGLEAENWAFYEKIKLFVGKMVKKSTFKYLNGRSLIWKGRNR
jgi:hypothetical protein